MSLMCQFDKNMKVGSLGSCSLGREFFPYPFYSFNYKNMSYKIY